MHIVREGAAVSWILASELLIHDGCTTGLESYFSEIPTINYIPFGDPETDLYLPNTVGVDCDTEEEVMMRIEQVLNGAKASFEFKQKDDLAFSLLENFDPNCDSFLNIASRIKIEIDKISVRKSSNFALSIFLLIDSCKNFLRNLAYIVIPKKKIRHMIYKSHFPGMSSEDIQRKLVCINEITDKNVKFEVLNKDLVKISLDERP